MEPNRNVLGWAEDIYPWLDEVAAKCIPHGGTYLEVGTFMGASLAHMGTIRPDLRLIAVDPWLDAPSQGYDGPGEYAPIQAAYGGLYNAFLAIMRREAPDVLRRTVVLRGTADTVQLLTPVDCLFIDGAHDRESVEKDIAVFGPLVVHGGVIAGHDYAPGFPGVKEVVDARYGNSARNGGRVHVQGSVWWVYKPTGERLT